MSCLWGWTRERRIDNVAVVWNMYQIKTGERERGGAGMISRRAGLLRRELLAFRFNSFLLVFFRGRATAGAMVLPTPFAVACHALPQCLLPLE